MRNRRVAAYAVWREPILRDTIGPKLLQHGVVGKVASVDDSPGHFTVKRTLPEQAGPSVFPVVSCSSLALGIERLSYHTAVRSLQSRL
jgi:hypothetical protein